jgi:hypothetical protein
VTGLIKKLFGSKSQPDKTASEPAPPPVVPVQTNNGRAFYLESDDAKTLGDLNYMRSSRSVRKTFPKAKFGADNELVRTISATEAARLGIDPAQLGATSKANPEASSQSASAESVSERRRGDSSLDRFRSMAREIKKN